MHMWSVQIKQTSVLILAGLFVDSGASARTAFLQRDSRELFLVSAFQENEQIVIRPLEIWAQDQHTITFLSLYGEGNGNPLQCSCLENPRDRGAWWAAVCGVAQSRTQLKRLSSSSSSSSMAFLVLISLGNSILFSTTAVPFHIQSWAPFLQSIYHRMIYLINVCLTQETKKHYKGRNYVLFVHYFILNAQHKWLACNSYLITILNLGLIILISELLCFYFVVVFFFPDE